MTSGLEANEWTAPYSSIKNPIVALWFPPCDDQITCILEKPLKHVPGTKFSYFGGSQILLGEIIRNATNLDIDSFSTKFLFEPLGIDTSDWAVRFPNGVIESAGGLKLTPRAMIKIGATFLNGGVWKEERIISEAWVQKSATDYPGNHRIKVPGESSGRRGYTYSWWTKKITIDRKEIATYCAGGWGGQNIIVIPEYNTVVVFTGGNYTTIPPQWKIMAKYVLPAIAS
jgi:CubicO group peptidase (beta-lactamase class C family)